jgi:hypothetical protein
MKFGLRPKKCEAGVLNAQDACFISGEEKMLSSNARMRVPARDKKLVRRGLTS